MTSSNKVRSKPYRDAARGQLCTLGIIGVCNHDTATTVLAHLPGEGKGTGTKVCDLNGADACASCHDVIDGRAPWPPGEEEHKEWYMRRALHRTIARREKQGIINVKGHQPC